ncbi:WD40-repeat-containing domain protein [Polychytrium aggregatum]|uniref:WD40-repeat-containing domain protein n=1 Tax=Polychytrium aggregatum TaxID=110093 RepID=UPI0022FE5C1B|nr:WD40-repeat-containing domain protein [Polychytrium aggregatum]KAI9202995.1 WD40-repeat-containing domain protein [Polychytrium aggregatum]
MGRLELIDELRGHSGQVWQVNWSPTAPVIASCGSDKSVRIWKRDAAGKFQCATFLDDAHSRTIRSVAFSPDGKRLGSASFDGTTAVWEKEEGDFECVATLEGHENEVKSVSWSVSGSLLATCSRDKSVWIWEVLEDNEFECLSVLYEHSQDVKMVQWHPHDDILASASYDDTVKVWREDNDDWYCSDTLSGHTSTVWGIDFDPSGNRLASVSDDKSMRVWKCGEPQGSGWRKDPKWSCVATLADHHTRTIYSVSWSKLNNKIATASGDNSIKIVEEGSDNEFKTVLDHPNAHGDSDINCVRWGVLEEDRDLIATAGDDGVIRIWRYIPL